MRVAAVSAFLATLAASTAVASAAPAAAVSALEGQQFSGVVDTVSCPTGGLPGNAAIDWGDKSQPTNGTVTPTGGKCTISGTHTYTEEASYTTTVTYNNGSNTDNGSVTVTDASPAAVGGGQLSGSAGAPVSGVVATFSDPAPEPSASYTATIDWGDGHSSPGAISGGYAVSGSHSYVNGGTYTVTVTIQDEGGAASTAHDVAAVSGCPAAAPIAPGAPFHPSNSVPDARYVQTLFHDLLGRVPSSSELVWAVQALSHGLPRDQLASYLLHSPEYRSDLVSTAYSTFLGRPADPAALNLFGALLQSGMTDEALDSQVLGSLEYFGRASNSVEGFLGALYCQTLFRAFDPAAKAYDESLLGAGGSRTTVAATLLGSTEYLTRLVNSYFLRFLGRAADPSSLNYFVSLMHGGATDEDVIAALVSSAEYYGRVNPAAGAVTIILARGIIHTQISRGAKLTLTVLHILHPAGDAALRPVPVPRTRMVGVVKFGYHRKGRVTLHWNRRVRGRRLARGKYVLLLRAYHAGKLIYVSDALPFRVR